MVADIAGYSALMERDESRTFGRIQALREQVITPKVAEFGGRRRKIALACSSKMMETIFADAVTQAVGRRANRNQGGTP